MQAPWYFGATTPTLRHQRPQEEKQKYYDRMGQWFKKGIKEVQHCHCYSFENFNNWINIISSKINLFASCISYTENTLKILHSRVSCKFNDDFNYFRFRIFRELQQQNTGKEPVRIVVP